MNYNECLKLHKVIHFCERIWASIMASDSAYDSSQLNPVAWFSSVQLDKHAIFIVLAQIKQVSGVGGLASLAIKDYILQF